MLPSALSQLWSHTADTDAATDCSLLLLLLNVAIAAVAAAAAAADC